MKIGVLSGKGGTGKTLVSVNLASVLSEKTTYIDCDVEEPNGWLFFKPEVRKTEAVYTMLPSIDNDKCVGCRKCIDFCKFNALAYTDKLLLFDKLCHGCNGCILLCPEKALIGSKREIGKVEYGKSLNVNTRNGVLNTGEVSGVPVINKLLSDLPKDESVIIDCPPGSSCAVMESIKDVDYCILVAEPTIFGVHNLSMVHKLVKLFNKPHGIVINKSIREEKIVEKYAVENSIPIIGNIPFDKELGSLNSQGKIISSENDKFYNLFNNIMEKVEKEVYNETVISS